MLLSVRHFNQCVTFILPFKVLSYLHITGTQCSPPFLSLILLCFSAGHIHKSKPVEMAVDYFNVFEIISLICWFREEIVQTATSCGSRWEMSWSRGSVRARESNWSFRSTINTSCTGLKNFLWWLCSLFQLERKTSCSVGFVTRQQPRGLVENLSISIKLWGQNKLLG